MQRKLNYYIFIQILYITLAGIPGIYKLLENGIPEWFNNLFQNSIFNLFPYQLAFCFYAIAIIEVSIAFLMVISIIRGEFRVGVNKKYLTFGLDISLILFFILFFGSFAIQNYDNGFKDFVYFIATLLVRRLMT